MICISLALYGCQNEDTLNKNANQSNVINTLTINEGRIYIENSAGLVNIIKDYQGSAEGQNKFNNKIISLQNEGFLPLEPLLSENNPNVKDFLIRKKLRIEKRNEFLGIKNKVLTNDMDYEMDLDDELITDPAFAALVNENGEIQIDDKVYKYTEIGLYSADVDNAHKIDEYLNTLTSDEKMNLYSDLIQPCQSPKILQLTEEVSHLIPARSEEVCGGGGGSFNWSSGINNPPPAAQPVTSYKPAAYLIKENLATCNITSNGFFEGIFGTTQTCYDYYKDNRRIKVKFWNQNFYFFSSIGSSARLQKREKMLGISYWEKSYASTIEMGLNYIRYDYTFNVPAFNIDQYNYETTFFEFNGVKYNSTGKVITKVPTGAGNFIFDTNDGQEVLNITILNNEISLNNAQINKIIDEAAKKMVDGIENIMTRSNLIIKMQQGKIKYNLLKAVPFSKKVTIFTTDVKWIRNNDNAITHYYDLNFLFTWKSSYEGIGDYLKGLSGSTPYTNVSADIYGAALHNNEWKGRRLILSN